MNTVKVYGQNRSINIAKALGWLARHIAEPYGDEFVVRTSRGVIYVPEEVVLTRPCRPRYITWSKRNVLKRDNYICAYCGGFGNTIDHVKPRSQCRQEGIYPNTWDNTVTACKKCNSKKGGKSLSEAGMRFRSGYKPTKPTHNTY